MMRKITIEDDNNQYDIAIREVSTDPKSIFPDKIDVGITFNGREYSGTLTKD